MILDLKSQFSAHFEMKYLCAWRYIIGMKIRRDRANRKIWITQSKYVKFVSERFNIKNCRKMVVLVV